VKTLRTKPVYKLYFRYKNITLWKNKTIDALTKKKWMLLKASKSSTLQYNRGIYLYHFKKLNLLRLYYYKFINKQLLKKYLVNYTESSFKSILFKNIQIFEKRLDFNLYQTNFVPSLYAARFFITKGYILVNKQIVKNTNFILKAHDLVEINPNFWNKSFSNLNINNKLSLTYLRNIEIDFTTLSFIFLDNKQFYILQFENFIKKVYFNLIKKKLSNYKSNSINNYFKFFETTFNYYLFLDESNKTLKYKSRSNNLRILNLLKYLRFYYNDYFFRNILLKRIFLYKYNYLTNITKSSNFKINNFYFFQNLNTNLISENHKNLLQTDFYKYVFNIIFKYYLFLLKNYYINNYSLTLTTLKSINNYKFILLHTKTLMFILRTKVLLVNYFTNTIITTNYIDIYKNNKYKLINTNCRPIKNVSKKTFLTIYKFHILLYYISSNRFKYKIYRKCNSFRQNIIKRHKLILHIRKTLNYRYYNQICLGNSYYLYTYHSLMNHLLQFSLKNNKQNNNLITKTLMVTTYYPKTTILYKTIYSTLSDQINITKNDIQNQLYQIKDILKNKELISKVDNLKYLHSIMNNLINKLKFFTTNRSYINFNYNKIYKNIFLLSNLINTLLTKNNINYNLTNLTYTFLYKVNVRNNYLYNKYNDFYTNTKRYNRYINYFNQRLKINYYYINSSKIYHAIGTNTKKYFLPLKTKIISNNFLYVYNRYRKQRSKYFYKRINNLTINNFTNISNTNNNYYFNMNIITNKLKFNDNLFYIDLLLNSSIRKINKLYNYTNNFKNISNNNSLTLKLSIQNKKNKVVKTNFAKNYKILFYSPLYTYYKNKIFNINFNKFYKLFNNSNFKYSNIMIFNYNKNIYNTLLVKKYFIFIKKHYCKTILLNKKNYISNFYLLFNYYNTNIRKYKLIKYLYKFYIFKEYNILLNYLINSKNLKVADITYIKQMYYNLLFTKLFNFSQFDYVLQNNYYFSRNLRIMINYFIIIKRLYK